MPPDSPTAEAPVPLITVAEAEEQTGFDAAELSFVPAGLNYLGARAYGDTINTSVWQATSKSSCQVSEFTNLAAAFTWRNRSIIVFLASKLRGWKDAV